MFHRCRELVGRNAQLLGKLLDRIGLDELSAFEALLHLILDAIKPRLVLRGPLLLDVLSVIGIKNRPCAVVRRVHASVGKIRLKRKLGAIALAILIHCKPAHDEGSRNHKQAAVERQHQRHATRDHHRQTNPIHKTRVPQIVPC